MLVSAASGVLDARPTLAQGTPAAPPSATELAQKLPFDPLVTVGTLDNGVRYYIRANQFPQKRAELRLVVNAGAVLEADDQRGLAHVVEHMAFNGTQHFPKQDLVHYLQSIGTRFGADLNAYTNTDETAYMLSVPTDTGNYLQKGIEILGDWAYRQTFDSAQIEGERGVVTEEWRLGRGAGARMFDRQVSVLFKGSKYADRNVIGDAEYLRTFPQDALKRFYKDWYRPELMAVVVVGDFDKATVERMIKEQFNQIPKSAKATVHPVYNVPKHDPTYVSIATDPEATNSSFTLYTLFDPHDQLTLGAFRDRFIGRLGFSMLNARLAEIGQKPNPPFAFAAAGSGRMTRSVDAFTVSGGVKESGMLTGFEAVLTEIERVARFGFVATELERAKANRLASSDRSYAEREKRASASHADELIRSFLQGEEVLGAIGEHATYQRLVPGVSLDEVNRVMRPMLTDRNRVLLVNAPENVGATLPTESQLLGVFATVKTKTLEPYKDAVPTASLIAKLPTPGSIVNQRTIPEIGVTEWKLSNGATVVLKPTDFMADQILLSGTSPGGTSLVPDSMYVSASLASVAASVGGVGALSAVDLGKVMSGKIASVNANIGSRTEGINGSASPKNVETMFQLAYLRFTAPRADSGAFLAFKQSMQASMANQAASPMSAYSDTVTATLTQHAFRARPLNAALLDEARLDRAFKVYRDRFADASDFTFFIVGNFKADSIKPLVQRYLGGLPSISRKEVAKDDGIRPPKGVVEKTVRRGVEPQSQTILAFTSPYAYSAQNSYVLSSLATILTNRLTDKLREALGGTYGVGVNAGGDRDDAKLASVSFSFGSSPDRADELTKAIFAEIEEFKTKGPTAADIEKVQETQRRTRETSLRQNAFWVARLSAAYQYGDDPRDVLKYDDLVKSLTVDAIREAAKQYIHIDNYVRVTLLPEVKTP